MPDRKHPDNQPVYSTGGPAPHPVEPEKATPAAKKPGEAVIRIEKKGRRGKTVTVVELREIGEAEAKELGRRLKQKAGVGGTTRGAVIELQGDHRTTARELLTAEGLKVKGG